MIAKITMSKENVASLLGSESLGKASMAFSTDEKNVVLIMREKEMVLLFNNSKSLVRIPFEIETSSLKDGEEASILVEFDKFFNAVKQQGISGSIGFEVDTTAKKIVVSSRATKSTIVLKGFLEFTETQMKEAVDFYNYSKDTRFAEANSIIVTDEILAFALNIQNLASLSSTSNAFVLKDNTMIFGNNELNITYTANDNITDVECILPVKYIKILQQLKSIAGDTEVDVYFVDNDFIYIKNDKSGYELFSVISSIETSIITEEEEEELLPKEGSQVCLKINKQVFANELKKFTTIFTTPELKKVPMWVEYKKGQESINFSYTDINAEISTDCPVVEVIEDNVDSAKFLLSGLWLTKMLSFIPDDEFIFILDDITDEVDEDGKEYFHIVEFKSNTSNILCPKLYE